MYARLAVKLSSLSYLIAPMLLIGMVHTSAFIAGNKIPDNTMKRVVEVLWHDPHYQSDYYDGKRCVPLASMLSNIYNRHELGAEFTRRAISATESEGSYLALANQYYNAANWEKAVHYYELTPSKYYSNPQ